MNTDIAQLVSIALYSPKPDESVAFFHDLLGIEERAVIAFRELLQPVERSRRDSFPDRDRKIDRHAAPARLVEQNDHFRLVRFHPVR